MSRVIRPSVISLPPSARARPSGSHDRGSRCSLWYIAPGAFGGIYETQIKAGKFVVIAHGTRDEVAKTKVLLSNAELHDGKHENCCA